MLFRTVIFIVFFIGHALLSNAQNIYTLKNQNIEISFDEKGNLVSLKNLKTGHNYASGRNIWRMYFDRKDQRDIEIQAKDWPPVVISLLLRTVYRKRSR